MGVARGDAVASEEREFAFDACATAASLGGGTIESPAVGKRPPIEAQAPARSVAQRLESLRQANEIRMKRAALKQALRDGTVRLEEILLEPPEYVERAKVRELFLAVPKLGPVRASRLLRACAISEAKTLGGLTERQRRELLAAVRD